jgi:hypothetical protein
MVSGGFVGGGGTWSSAKSHSPSVRINRDISSEAKEERHIECQRDNSSEPNPEVFTSNTFLGKPGAYPAPCAQ